MHRLNLIGKISEKSEMKVNLHDSSKVTGNRLGENIYKPLPNKWLIYRIYKELLQLNNKTRTLPQHRQRVEYIHVPKADIWMANKDMTRSSKSLTTGKM